MGKYDKLETKVVQRYMKTRRLWILAILIHIGVAELTISLVKPLHEPKHGEAMTQLPPLPDCHDRQYRVLSM